MTKFIPSTYLRDKQKQVFIIEHDGIRVQVEVHTKPRSLLFFVNGQKLSETQSSDSLEASFPGNSGSHSIVASNTRNKTGPFLINPLAGVAITIDGIPVQNSIADPYTVLKSGRVGVGFFCFLYLLKTAAQLAGFNNPNPFPDRLFAALIYLLPAIVLLISFFSYKRGPKPIIYVAIVLALLECADFVWGLVIHPEQISAGAVSVLIFAGLRLSSLYALFKALTSIKRL